MIRATVLTIGNELLSGRTLDTNFGFLARALGAAGVLVHRHLSVGDDRAAILAALDMACADSELVLVSGGLGPTADDVTRDCLGELAGVPLVEDPAVLERIAARYASLGRELGPVGRRQALLPSGMVQLENPIGLAPGLWFERGGTVFCALPGIPRELEAMTREVVLPRLKARFPGLAVLPAATVRTTGIPESEIAERVEKDGVDLSRVVIAYLPGPGGVDVRITGSAPEEGPAVARVTESIAALLPTQVYARGEESIEEVVGRLLLERKLTLALAESCTGGLVGYRVTQIPGSSAYFSGGVVAYANEAKDQLLGVQAALLAGHGAVSAEVAAAMARGAVARFASDIGLAVTGIAGPGGGTPEKPVGLVYVAVASNAESAPITRRFLLPGNRQQVRERAATLALDLVRRVLLDIAR
jgi:nicotinamide-nucleotide amidase